MITILKESEVKGKAEFVPSAENLKNLLDTALEMSTDTADAVEKIKSSVDVLMLAIAELQEIQDADNKEEKGDDENVKDKN